jgi:perosamine synthetase
VSGTSLALFGGAPAVTALPTRAWPFYREDTRHEIAERVRVGDVYAAGHHADVALVEDRFRAVHADVPFAVFTSSGTAALFSAYFGLELPAGSEVLVPTNTFLATATPLFLLNLRPVLCDADPATGEIDLDDAGSRVTARTSALVVTHLWGHPADMVKVVEFTRRHGLALVEDCSHAHGGTYRERPVGTFGDAAAFSMSSRKTVSGGTAGMLLTTRRDVYERALLLGHPAARTARAITDPRLTDYVPTAFGANLRGTPVTARLALDHVDRLPETIVIRNANLAQLDSAIASSGLPLSTPTRSPSFTDGCWYGYKVRWPTDHPVPRPVLAAALRAEGVAIDVPGPLLHSRLLFRDPSPMGSFVVGLGDAACNPEGYPGADTVQAELMTIDTRMFFDRAPDVLAEYADAFAKVGSQIDVLADRGHVSKLADVSVQ